LRNNCFDAAIDGSQMQDMSSTVGCTPDSNLIAINSWQALRVCYGILDIALLVSGKHFVSGLPFLDITGAKPTVVKYETSDLQFDDKMLGEGVKAHLFEHGKGV
jgi:hypothetical protein